MFDATRFGAKPMQHQNDDVAKQRLIERIDILTAINILRLRGYTEDELLNEVVRLFYVDLDEYNSVVKAA